MTITRFWFSSRQPLLRLSFSHSRYSVWSGTYLTHISVRKSRQELGSDLSLYMEIGSFPESQSGVKWKKEKNTKHSFQGDVFVFGTQFLDDFRLAYGESIRKLGMTTAIMYQVALTIFFNISKNNTKITPKKMWFFSTIMPSWSLLPFIYVITIII